MSVTSSPRRARGIMVAALLDPETNRKLREYCIAMSDIEQRSYTVREAMTVAIRRLVDDPRAVPAMRRGKQAYMAYPEPLGVTPELRRATPISTTTKGRASA